MPRLTRWCVVFLFATLNSSPAQNLIANPSFESGAASPTNWVFNSSAYCSWDSFGHTGTRSVSVTNFNYNCNGMQWRSAAFPVEPGKPYLVNLWAVCSNAPEIARIQVGLGTPAGNALNSRFVFPPARWAAFPFAALAPRNQSSLLLQLISCEGYGKLSFDDAEVLPGEPAHSIESGAVLGYGEKISPGKYTFAPDLRDAGQGFYFGNYSRCAYDCTAFYSTFYTWYMDAGTQFTYTHEFGGHPMTNATARVYSAYAWGGALKIEFSADGINWLTGTNYTPGFIGYKDNTNVVPAPAELFPCTNLSVRVRVDNGGFYYVRSYTFEADVPAITGTDTGSTILLGQRVPRQSVEIVGLTNRARVLLLDLANNTIEPRDFAVEWSVAGPSGVNHRALTNTVAAQTTNRVEVPFAAMGWWENTLSVEVKEVATGTTNFSAWGVFRESVLDDASFGWRLPAVTNASVWWCEAAYKVGPNRPAPEATNGVVQLAAARNDYEPVQVVLAPTMVFSNTLPSITDFVALGGAGNGVIGASNVSLTLVDFVPVTTPTDPTGVPGLHPDPLLPWTQPITLEPGTNHSLWLTVYVPKDVPAGDYEATLSIQSAQTAFTVPIRLHVFDFSLSDVTHTRWATRVRVDEFWHACTNSSMVPVIYDLYMQNFRRHRVSPINPDLFGSLTWAMYNGTNGPYFTYNFSNFDASLEKYLDEFGFSGVNVPVVPTSSQLNGYPRFGPQYQELYNQLMGPIMQHLRERGRLAEAYCWWYDEPDPPALANIVIPGMKSVGLAAPGLKRQLTREPIPELFGEVETWVPLTHWVWMELPSFAARKAAGDTVQWYLAGVPGAPHPNWLTDHPAINARIRSWMAEKFGLDGEMYWNTTWWIGDKHAPINPWTNTLTRIFDGMPVGNGNGVLFYPPTRTPPTSLLVTNALDTLRWELIREGQEDREYFWLLNQYLARRAPALGTNHPAVIQAKAAREYALSIVLSRTYYESDPQKLYTGRKAVAEAIEALDDGAPFIVRDPVSRAVALGSNVVLRAEAIGWPPPAYQWQHEGTNYPGATNAVLALTNFDAALLGTWRVVASNSAGVATSVVAKLAGYWVPAPQIIAQSAVENRRVGDRTVLEVTAVSALPVSYTWYLNGNVIAGATNNTLAFASLAISNGGLYHVVVSNTAGVVTSAPIILLLPTVVVLPQIVASPTNVSVNAGQTAQFNVSAAGTGALNYQWYFNSTNLLANATNSALSLPNAQPIHAGGYSVVVGDTNGSSTSGVATLTVLFPPEILQQPTNQTTLPDGSAQFSVLANGTPPLSYQWYHNDDLLASAQDANLTRANVQVAQAGFYRVVVSNAAGAVTSSVATLTVLGPAQIVEPPANLTVAAGNTASFVVIATGSAPLHYQWWFNTTNLLAKATNDVLVLTNAQLDVAGGYSVVITNSLGAATSEVAALTVLLSPQFLESPTNQTASPGNDVVFAAVVTGTAPLNYQWYFNSSTLLPNAGAPTLSLSNVQSAHAGRYHLLVTNTTGAATSSPAWLYIMPNFEFEPPDFVGTWLGLGTGYELQLPVDNRPRTVLVSSNLFDWSTQFVVIPSGLPQVLTDSTATNQPQKFYRVRAN